MLTYVKQIADAILATSDLPVRFDLTRALHEELGRLDPRDFLPSVRFEFVRCRATLRGYTQVPGHDPPGLNKLVSELAPLLDKYSVHGKGPTIRDFRWLSTADLRDIIARDYAELSHVLLPDGAWKSTVVMAGSILEAILVDLITQDPIRLAAARLSSKSPRDKAGMVKHEDDWTLYNLIEIATAIGLLPHDRAKTFDQILRDYRNFVHPRKELRAKHACNDGEALMAKGALDAICDHFDRTLS